MATLPANDYAEEADEAGEASPKPDTLTLAQILAPGLNLAELLPPEKLNEIGRRCITDFDIDDGSRGDWETRYKRWLDVAMQVKAAKNFPWPGAANVKYPLLTVASIQFQARAYPVIVDGSNLVRGRVLGPDPDGQKRARADRIGQHMTWQLLYRMPGWEEDTDRLLLVLPIVGCMFRKSYYDSIANANCSETVSALDFVINYWAKSIDSAPRYTHILHYYPYEVREKVAAGLWLEVPLDDDGENTSSDDDQALGDYYEQHRCIDLDGDGYPEHYVVTCTKEGNVARIAPCFGLDCVTVRLPDELPGGHGGTMIKLDELLEKSGVDPADFGRVARVLPDLKIVKIERRQYFTKYPFIPAPDGSFYDIGFGSLLDDISGTIDTTLNQMIDAGALQNAGGGFVGAGVQIRGGNFKFRLGEWKRADVTGGTLRENVVPLPAPGPSQVLLELLGLLITSAKEITAASDALTGTGASTEQPTTLLARIEQAQKVLTGVIKRILRSFGEELRILRCLNRDYLDEEEYFQLNDSEDAVKIGRADYEDRDLDVIPVADPSQISDVLRMARSDAEWATFNGDPLVNQLELRRRRMEALGVTDIKTMLTVPPPQIDPKIASEAEKNAAAADASRATAADTRMDAAVKALGIGLVEDATVLAAQAVGDTNAQAPAGPGSVPGMESTGPDAGVPGLPAGPAGGPDAGVGPGSFPDAGGAGGGGAAGPVGGPEF